MGEEVEELPKAVWEGTFSVGGFELKVYVLEDGRRIMDAESFTNLFSRMKHFESAEMWALTEFMRSKHIPETQDLSRANVEQDKTS